MPDDFEIEAARAVQLVDRDPARACEVLVGCGLYMEDDEALLAIVAVDLDARQFRCGVQGAERWVAFSSGRKYWVVDERDRLPLKQLETSLKTEAELESERASRLLASLGLLAANMSSDDARTLAAALGPQALPDRTKRYECFELFKLYGLERQALPVVSAWVEAAIAAGAPDYNGPIQLGYLYRRAGRIEEALKWADIRLFAPILPTDHQKAILLTERAAILLDHYDRAPASEEQKREWLDEADRCARHGWAVEPSVELSNVFERMKRVRSRGR